jgi:hypothetical protein
VKEEREEAYNVEHSNDTRTLHDAPYRRRILHSHQLNASSLSIVVCEMGKMHGETVDVLLNKINDFILFLLFYAIFILFYKYYNMKYYNIKYYNKKTKFTYWVGL